MTEQDFHHHKHEKKKLHQKVYFKCNEKPDVISYSKRANHSIFQKSSKYHTHWIVKKLTVVSSKDFIFCPVVLSIQVLIYRTEKIHIV